jgi:hypothetical protein
MSTRGCVAIRKKDGGWVGVYNHSDSYPTCLGKEVWDHLQGKNLKRFAGDLLRFDTWDNYLEGGVCPYCGKRGLSSPHSIRGEILGRTPPDYGRGLTFESSFKTKEEMREYYESLPAWRGKEKEIEKAIETEWRLRENIEKTGYVDPECKFHEHDSLDDPGHITSENPDPLFIEWVYVIDPEHRTVDILAHVSDEKTDGPVRMGSPVLRSDGYWDYGHCACKHIKIARISLDGREPDWNLLQSIPHFCLDLLDVVDLESLVYQQLRMGKIERTKCGICGGTAYSIRGEAAHERCLRRALDAIGGDTEALVENLRVRTLSWFNQVMEHGNP